MKDKIHNRDNMKETHHIVPVFYKNTISRGERKSKKPEKLDDAEMEQNHKKTENVTRRYKTKNEESPIHYFCYTWSLNNNHTDDRQNHSHYNKRL